jgi:DNA-binding PadR family transcriptional regulator
MPKKSLDPMPMAAFQILVALAGEDLHGYGIMRKVREQSGGKVRLGPGTLYGSIQKLLDGGLIEEFEERPDPDLGPDRRRHYRLTTLGRKQAQSAASFLADLLRVARTQKILRGAHV